ncbi:MAG: type II CAAX endopeptidase family protein [Spirochaetaceae bacterium]|jgi:membrane protease YdiL (CAAX protease family)|nr:type II CAAX endopeptidase family protein [Spirochaetaceae bacterium]
MVKENRALLLTIPAAFILFYISFMVPWGIFWIKIALSASILATMAGFIVPYVKDKFKIHYIFTGLGSAVILYIIFYAGNIILPLVISGSGERISSVYEMKGSFSPLIITLLLLFITSPAEELFWRGFIQKTFSSKLGKWTGYIMATLLYSAVHVFTFNLPLIMAALVAGAAWGLLYMFEKNIIPVIISHSLWTVLVFIIFPVA